MDKISSSLALKDGEYVSEGILEELTNLDYSFKSLLSMEDDKIE